MVENTPVGRLSQECAAACAEAWWRGTSRLPELPRTYARCEQRRRERELRLLVDELLEEAQHPPTTVDERRAAERRLSLSGRAFARASLGASDAHVDLLLHGGFATCATEFARRAREFAPSMPLDEIFQASRNVWTMNGLQVMLGLPLRVTPSVFAYSMLYPLTDNLLDDPTVRELDKVRLGERFGRRLAGDPLPPESQVETDLWRLVAEVESEHVRAEVPRVYESLAVIHSAQARSLSLLERDEPPYGIDVLGISLEKGGASVLADGYLVAGDLSQANVSLFFSLGALLQLADDLQDAAEDARCGMLTVFSQLLGRWPLDRLVFRLLHFRAWVLEQLRPNEAPAAAALADLLRGASLQIILGAVAAAPRQFTPDCVRRLEAHSPFGFRALRREKRRLERRRDSSSVLAAALAAALARDPAS
ncbi:MAG: hypothetical protein AB1778_03930 [Candidatus Bipolaricaulota bacterium]